MELALLKKEKVCWRDGAVIKSTFCSYRGPRFNSRHLHDGLRHLFLTPVLGNLKFFSDFLGHPVCVLGTCIHLYT